MTDYIRRIRELLDKTSTGKNRDKMLLGAILPWDYEFCLQEGLQVETCVEEGLVDYLSPGDWYYTDWNVPLKKWCFFLYSWGEPVENAGIANTMFYFSRDVTITAHLTENYPSVHKIVHKTLLGKATLFFLT